MAIEYLPDHIGEQSLPSDRQTISEWNVYLPANVDRDKYIQNCFLTGTITLHNSKGAEIVHRVRIGSLALQCVRFPRSEAELGSDVICCTSPYSGKLFVVDVFDQRDQYNSQGEDQFCFRKLTDGGSASVLIDGGNGIISITVDKEGSGGELSINIASANADSLLNINVKGNVSVEASGAIDIVSASGSSINVDDAGVNISAGDNKVFVNGGKQVLFANVEGATEILDVSEIGVSQKVSVG
jgi:hypothetical protein